MAWRKILAIIVVVLLSEVYLEPSSKLDDRTPETTSVGKPCSCLHVSMVQYRILLCPAYKCTTAQRHISLSNSIKGVIFARQVLSWKNNFLGHFKFSEIPAVVARQQWE